MMLATLNILPTPDTRPERFSMHRLVLFAALSFWSGAAQAQDVTGIARAIDGDSLKVGATEVRLSGIDAPEYKQTCRVGISNWSCGADAAAALRGMVDGRQLRCLPRDRDVYGRTVATCTLNGVDVAETMVRRGLAIVLENGTALYRQTEAQSKAARAGIWASDFQPPAAYRAANPRAGTSTTAIPTSRTVVRRQGAPAESSSMWRSCAAARAAGAAPVYRGQPGYNPNLDGDHDGIACEPYRGQR